MGSVNSLPVSGLLATPLYCRDLKEEKHLRRSERCASSWASAPSRSTCCRLSASAQGAQFSFLHAKPPPWNLGHADPSPGIPERWDKLPELGGGTQLSTQPATQSLAGTVCLSLNSSCPSGVIIASQRKVGATIQSHHTDLPHRATMYRKTESYITARRDQSRKAWVRKERGAWRRGLLSLRVLTLLSLPGETMRR